MGTLEAHHHQEEERFNKVMGNHIALLRHTDAGGFSLEGEFANSSEARRALRQAQPGQFSIASMLEVGITVDEPVTVTKAVVGGGTKTRTRKGKASASKAKVHQE